MAKAKTLDDFLKLWESYEDIKKDISNYSQDPSNPGIYTKVIARQADMLGVKPEVLQTDPATNQRIEYSPTQIRSFLEGENGKGGQRAYNQQTAHQYAEENLDSIIKGIPNDTLEKLLGFNIPKGTGNKAHDEAANLHMTYVGLSRLVEAYVAEKKGAFPDILKSSESAAIELLKEKYGEDEVTKVIKGENSPLAHVINSALYTVRTNFAVATRIIQEVAKIKYKALTEKIKGKTAEYIADNLRNSEPGEREQFYEGMHRTLAKEDERHALRMAA